MIGVIFLAISICFGFLLLLFLFRHFFQKEFILLLCASFCIGIFFSTWIVFLFNFILPITVATILACVFLLVGIYLLRKHFHPFTFSISKFEYFIFACISLFAIWFANQTIPFFPDKGTIKLARDVTADFELHIPLMRSFSLGNNIPPESPFFPNKNLSYHFLFDYHSSILEASGFSTPFAINIPSILAFISLLYLLFKFPQYLFIKNNFIGVISILLFLFNSSFGFLDAINKFHPTSVFNFLEKMWNATDYVSVAPFQKDYVAIMWNLNVYANQRHLIFASALSLVFLLLLFYVDSSKIKRFFYTVFFSLLLGLLPLWQSHIFISLILILLIFTIPRVIKKNFSLVFVVGIAAGIAAGQFYFLSQDVEKTLIVNYGFLADKPLTFFTFSSFWYFNVGLSLCTIVFGFLLSNTKQRIFYLGILSIFIVANIYQFNKEMFNNHKFFNYWILLSNMYSAYLLYHLKQKRFGIIFSIIIFISLTFSGVIDFMVLKNTPYFTIADTSSNNLSYWVKNNTEPSATFLIPQDEFYHPIRMAGRKTFQYKPRYAWAYGYDTESRDRFIEKLYHINNQTTLKSDLVKNQIRYVVLPKDRTKAILPINYDYFNSNFKTVYEDQAMEIVKIL